MNEGVITKKGISLGHLVLLGQKKSYFAIWHDFTEDRRLMFNLGACQALSLAALRQISVEKSKSQWSVVSPLDEVPDLQVEHVVALKDVREQRQSVERGVEVRNVTWKK